MQCKSVTLFCHPRGQNYGNKLKVFDRSQEMYEKQLGNFYQSYLTAATVCVNANCSGSHETAGMLPSNTNTRDALLDIHLYTLLDCSRNQIRNRLMADGNMT